MSRGSEASSLTWKKLGLRSLKSLQHVPAHEWWANDRVSRHWLLDAREAPMASPMTFGPRTTTIALWWQPTKPSLLVLVVLLLFLITLESTRPRGRESSDAPPPRSNHCFFFVSSLALTVTMVPKICNKPRPTRSRAQPVRANCVKGLAARCDLCAVSV